MPGFSAATPKISIVTPSLDQAAFLEQCLESIHGQNYPNLEHIVLDGGSADGSPEILRRFESRLAFWRSGPDGGMGPAVHEGIRRATGEIAAVINADDYLLPGALRHVAECFAKRPRAEWLVGGCLTVGPRGEELYRHYGYPFDFEALLFWGCRFNSTAAFFSRQAVVEAGIFDPGLRFCIDYDMFFRLARRGPAMATRRILGAFRLHPLSKTSTLHERKRAEDRLLWQRYGRYETPEPRRRALFRKHARRFALRKTAFLALDALGDPRMAWREIRRRAAVALRGDYRAEMDRDSPSPPRRLE